MLVTKQEYTFIQYLGWWGQESKPQHAASGICGYALRSYFRIPNTVKKIFITLSTTPTRDSYEIMCDHIFYIKESNGDWVYQTLMWGVKDMLCAFLKKHDLSTCFITIQYEE